MAAWEFRQRGCSGVILLCGNWLSRTAGARMPAVERLSRSTGLRRLTFDASRLGRWDTTLVAFLWDVKRAAAASGVSVDDTALPSSVRKLLGLLPARPKGTWAAAPPQSQALSWIGRRAVDLLVEIGDGAVLTAMVAAGTVKIFLRRARLRTADFVSGFIDAGPRAVPIVGIVNFLVGAILAFIGAAELRQFAAQTYVADLVGVASVRELASVITAIVMAGRTGGAYAARIASMRGNDEIAALRVLGIPIEEFLVLPSVASLCATMPILYLIGCFCAIAGGLAVATVSLDFTSAEYLRQTYNSVPLADFAIGVAKSIAFAGLIGITSCRMGLKAARNAQAVGTAATGAVVVNIVGIIGLDAMFAVIFEKLGA